MAGLDLIPPGATYIVELGAGSGLLTALVQARFPEARLHLVDFSPSMLELAKTRLGNDPKIAYEQADFVIAPLPANVHAVVSSPAIHHLDHRQKQVVFRKIHDALAPGGVFVNADQVAGPTPDLERRYHAKWLQQVKANGATAEQLEAVLYRMREDRCAPVEEQLRWMREAGFEDADCWYKDNRVAVMAGTRRP